MPGLPAAKMIMWSPIGPRGADVSSPLKARLRDFFTGDYFRIVTKLLVGEVAHTDWKRDARIQERALDVVRRA